MCEGYHSDIIWHHSYCVGGSVVGQRRKWEQQKASHPCISSASKCVQGPIDFHLQQKKNHTTHGWTCTHWFTIIRLSTANDVSIIVTWWLSNESGFKPSWTGRKRDTLESFQAFENPGLSFSPACCMEYSWWSVMLGHLGISVFCLKGSKRNWDWQFNRNLIKLRYKQTLWIPALQRKLVILECKTKLLSGKPEVFAL